MVSKVKLYSQLDRLEGELRDRLIPHLEAAVSGRNDFVFCATGLSSPAQLKSGPNQETDELIQIGRQVLALREKLGEPAEGAIAERICWYCRKWSDAGNGHKDSAQALASAFFQEVTEC